MDWLDAVLAQAAGAKAEIAPRPRTRFDLPLSEPPAEAAPIAIATPPQQVPTLRSEPTVGDGTVPQPSPLARDEATPPAAVAPVAPAPLTIERTHEVRVEHTVERREIGTIRVEHEREVRQTETVGPTPSTVRAPPPAPAADERGMPEPIVARATPDRPVDPLRGVPADPPQRIVPVATTRREQAAPAVAPPAPTPEAPSVRITIGRLDVRAVLQAPPAPTPRPRDAETPARGRAPTLEAYLRGRQT